MCNTSAKRCNTSAKSVIPCKLHCEILDYAWPINNAVFERTNQICCFQIKHMPWIVQFYDAVFPRLRDTRACLLLNHLEFFHVYY